jgi:hypothetical protein
MEQHAAEHEREDADDCHDSPAGSFRGWQVHTIEVDFLAERGDDQAVNTPLGRELRPRQSTRASAYRPWPGYPAMQPAE